MNEENLILIRHVMGVEIYKDTTTGKEYLAEADGFLKPLN